MKFEISQWKVYKAFRASVLFITLSLLASSTLAQTMLNANQKIRVMNYNIKGTPGIAGGNSKKNLNRIAEEITKMNQNGNGPDVILFQEVFTKDAKKAIRSLNGSGLYPFMAHGNGKEEYSYSSGLTIVSKFPFIYQDTVSYGKANCASWDCHSNKGAQIVAIKADNWPEPIGIVNTHMQASNEFDQERVAQMKILKKFLTYAESFGYSIIIGGDLNTKPNRPSYPFFKSLFPTFINVGEYCISPGSKCAINALTPKPHVLDDTKDHQFFSCSKNAAIIPVKFVRNFSKEVDGLDLSDHRAYQVDYELDWTSNKACHL